MKMQKEDSKRCLLEILQAVQQQIKDLNSIPAPKSQPQLIQRLQNLTVRLHHEFCQSEHLMSRLQQCRSNSNGNTRKIELLNQKMDLFKKRFTEQRKQTKLNQQQMQQCSREQLVLQEQANDLEKEIQTLEKCDENQQLIVQNLEEDNTELTTLVNDLTDKVKILDSRLISQL